MLSLPGNDLLTMSGSCPRKPRMFQGSWFGGGTRGSSTSSLATMPQLSRHCVKEYRMQPYEMYMWCGVLVSGIENQTWKSLTRQVTFAGARRDVTADRRSRSWTMSIKLKRTKTSRSRLLRWRWQKDKRLRFSMAEIRQKQVENVRPNVLVKNLKMPH